MSNRIVYICSPYAGDVDANVRNARRYSRFAVDRGYLPIAPHLLFPQFLNDADPKERELGLSFGNALMGMCSEIWVFGNRISNGMEAEIRLARPLLFRHVRSTGRDHRRQHEPDGLSGRPGWL